MIKAADVVDWPEDMSEEPTEQQVLHFMAQWRRLIVPYISDGTSHMQCAIPRILAKIEPERLREVIQVVAHTGKLKYGLARHSDPYRRQRWLGKALWFCDAAIELVGDASQAYDKWRHIRDEQLRRNQQQVHMLQHHQQPVQMRPTFSTRMDGIHQQQYHTTYC